MDLKSLISAEKTIKMDFPGIEGFKITLAYLSRDELQKIRKKCTVMNINKKTRKPEEEVDDELFANVYIKSVIKDWEGLKAKHLVELLPIEADSVANEEEDVPYNEENARTLMRDSFVFDAWVTEVISDVSNFNKDSMRKNAKK